MTQINLIFLILPSLIIRGIRSRFADLETIRKKISVNQEKSASSASSQF